MKSKKEEKKIKEGFLWIPDEYLQLKSVKIGADEIMLLVKIDGLSNRMDCIATNAFLAKYMKTSERSVGRHLKNLIDAGLVNSIPNPKSISNRTLKVNHEKINELLYGGRQNCQGKEGFGTRVDNIVDGGWTELSSEVDNIGNKNAENDCNSNGIPPLKDNIKHNKINNNIHTDVGTSAIADVNASHSKESASADLTAPQSGGASHLTSTEEIFACGRDSIIEVMEEFVEKGVFEVTDLIKGTDEYDDTLVAVSRDFLDVDKVKTIDDVISQLRGVLDSHGCKM